MKDPVAQLRAAAFHGADIDDGLLARAASGEPVGRWLAAVLLGARGRYGRALSILEPLTADARPWLASLAYSTIASHRRQLGGHDDARRWDARAVLRTAGTTGTAGAEDPDGVDPAGARADALLGLAADAVGAGRVAVARALVGRVRDDPPASWRVRVRRLWVSAEIALVAGDPAAAIEPADAARRLARAHDAPRHAVKSDIVLAAALRTAAREPQRAERLIASALDQACRRGLDSLVWPASSVAGRPVDRDAVLYRVLRRADPAGRALAVNSAWMPVTR